MFYISISSNVVKSNERNTIMIINFNLFRPALFYNNDPFVLHTQPFMEERSLSSTVYGALFLT